MWRSWRSRISRCRLIRGSAADPPKLAAPGRGWPFRPLPSGPMPAVRPDGHVTPIPLSGSASVALTALSPRSQSRARTASSSRSHRSP